MSNSYLRPLIPLTLLTWTLVPSGVANASTLSFHNVYDPSDVLFSRDGLRSLDFTHDLSAEGFDPATDTLTAATLSLYLRDESDSSAEKVDITLDDLWFYNNERITSGSGPTRFTFDTTLLVAPDGTLKVSLSRQNGTFYFEQSLLEATGTRVDPREQALTTPTDLSPFLTAIPEPASLILLGSGLLGLNVRRWRQRKASYVAKSRQANRSKETKDL